MARSEHDLSTLIPGQQGTRNLSELYGFDSVGGVWRRVSVTPTGELSVNMSGGISISNVTITDVTPGSTVTTSADVPVGVGATVALPAVPANTRRMTVQNTGPSGTLIRVREVGGPAGSGIILTRFGIAVYGGADGAIAALEVEEIAGIATSVAVQFERD